MLIGLLKYFKCIYKVFYKVKLEKFTAMACVITDSVPIGARLCFLYVIRHSGERWKLG